MAVPLSRLAFRRQFVLGPRPFRPEPEWTARPVGSGRSLSTHPDLDVVEAGDGERQVVLLGLMVDPLQPDASAARLVDELAELPDLDAVLERTDGYTGRWAVLTRWGGESYLLHDAFGARSIYWVTGPDERWCGSDPALLREVVPFGAHDDDDVREFLASPRFLLYEGAWVGDGTRWKGVRHLLPNHVLDLESWEAERVFPRSALATMSVNSAAEIAAGYLEGAMDAFSRRGRLALAVTAGLDSRVLLAASRRHLGSIDCFVDRFGLLPEDHPDVTVPQELARCLGFEFTVEDSDLELPVEIRRRLEANVDGARDLPRTRAIWSRLARGEDRLGINGNGNEVARRYFAREPKPEPERDGDGPPVPEPERLARIFGYGELPYAIRELERWRDRVGSLRGIDPLDLLYWEQRMGNWGTLFVAEQDMAMDEVSPFNNRRLLCTLLAVPAAARSGPDYPLSRRIIELLWPETLEVPINPPAPPVPTVLSDELFHRLRIRSRETP
jgi:hypothetical protein